MKTRKLIQRTGRNAIADHNATTECSAAADRNTATACNRAAAAVAAAARKAAALLMAATLLLLPSCTDELSASKDSNDGNATAETRTMTITATMADDGDNNGNGTTGSNTGNGNDGQAQTRVSHKSDPDGGATPGVIVKWTKGDAFKLFYETTNSGTTEEKITEFKIETAEAITNEGKTADFTGSLAIGASGEATALYPATAALTLKGVTATKWSEIALKMEGQKQTGNDNYDHLPAYDYMTASTNNVNNGNGNDLAFHHLAAMMTIKITGAPTDYTATTGTTDNSPELLTLTAGQDPNTGKYGTFCRCINANGKPITNVNTYPSSTSSINLALEGITWGDKGFTAHLMMLPTDLNGKTFTVSVRCKDGTTYQYTTKKIGKEYVAGMRYTATIDGGEKWTKMTDKDEVKEVFSSQTEATMFSGGGKTPTDPYIISTAGELKYLVEQANSNQNYGYNTYFRLTTDIKVEDNTDWTPIGVQTKATSYNYGFCGHFDGGGHTIYGTLTDNRTEDKGYDDNYFGFFGRINLGSVRNLNIKATVINTYKGSLGVYTGGLAGNIDKAEISGCNINVVIQGGTTTGKGSTSYTGGLIGQVNVTDGKFSSTISNCTVSGEVKAGKMPTDKGVINYTGGMAGYISANTSYPITIKNCTNHATITGSSGGGTSDSDTGGIAGFTSHANISHCTNDGKVSVQYTASGGNCLVGGLIGLMDSYTNLSDSENQGAVIGGQVHDTNNVSCCGGLAGHTQSTAVTATNCTNSGTVSGNEKNTNIINHTGGLVGRNNGTLHQCHNTAEGAVTQGASNANNHTGGLVGHNNSTGKVYNCCTNLARVNDADATDANRIGGGDGKIVTNCEEGHTPPATTTDKHISSDVNENYEEEIL